LKQIFFRVGLVQTSFYNKKKNFPLRQELQGQFNNFRNIFTEKMAILIQNTVICIYGPKI
jgi:hypothetical protein